MLPTPPEGAIAKIMLFVVMGAAVVAAFTALWPIFLGAGVIYVIQRMWSAWMVSKLSPEEKVSALRAAHIAYDKQREAQKAFEAARDATTKNSKVGYWD